MSDKGVSVINLTNVLKMAEKFGLPTVIGPEPPVIGIGSLYYKGRYDISKTLILTIILAVIVFAVIRIDLKFYLRRNPRMSARNVIPSDRVLRKLP